jgi:hypothetical protein
MNEANAYVRPHYDVYIIYDHPNDYPNEYVVRRRERARYKEIVFKSENIDAVREHLSQLFLKMDIDPMIFKVSGPDPKILEEWV